MADRYKDEFFEAEKTGDVEKAFLRGQLNVIDDIVGLAAFIKAFKELTTSKQEMTYAVV